MGQYTEIIVYVSLRMLCLSVNNKCYPVVANNELTVRGEYAVENIVYDPLFKCPPHLNCDNAPLNTIGTRAITMDKTLVAIHGWHTSLDFTTMTSAGCVRMNNEDIEHLIDNYVFTKIHIK